MEDQTPDWKVQQDKEQVEILRDIGVTPAEASLFNVIHFGLTVPPDDLIGRAGGLDYSMGGRSSQKELSDALDCCLVKGWLQVVDEAVLQQIKSLVRSLGLLGPIYKYPYLNGVDFTATGAGLWQEYCRLSRARHPQLKDYVPSFLDTVHEKYSRYFTTRAAAEEWIAELKQYEVPPVSIQGPTQIGPWRAQWWRRFDAGYRIDVEERRTWQGRAGGEGTFIYYSSRLQKFSLVHVQAVLQKHPIHLVEWICLRNLENETYPEGFVHETARLAQRLLKVKIDPALCETAFESCLNKNWLRIVDEHSRDEVRSLLAADPVFQPVPQEVKRAAGFVDFTPAGAALYRQLSAEILGPDWEEALAVSVESYREDHHYSESHSSFQRVFQEIADRGERISAMQIEPIGPWCGFWWEQFPAGFRLEIQIGKS